MADKTKWVPLDEFDYDGETQKPESFEWSQGGDDPFSEPLLKEELLSNLVYGVFIKRRSALI